MVVEKLGVFGCLILAAARIAGAVTSLLSDRCRSRLGVLSGYLSGVLLLLVLVALSDVTCGDRWGNPDRS